MLDAERISQILAGLKVLKFFPDDPVVIATLTRMVCQMAATEGQVQWLVDRMTIGSLYSEWPGPGELRGCFCSKFKPQDGINAYSTVYPDGIPSEKPAPPPLPALPPGHQASVDARLERGIAMLAEVKDIRHVRRRAIQASETPELPPEKRITQIDIDREMAKREEAKQKRLNETTRQELEGGAENAAEKLTK